MGINVASNYSIEVVSPSNNSFRLDNIDHINIAAEKVDTGMFGFPRASSNEREIEVTAYVDLHSNEDLQDWFSAPQPREVVIYNSNKVVSVAQNSYISSYNYELSDDGSEPRITFNVKSTSVDGPSEGYLRQRRIKQGIAHFHNHTK